MGLAHLSGDSRVRASCDGGFTAGVRDVNTTRCVFFFWFCFSSGRVCSFKEQTTAVKRTLGGQSTRHIKTLTPGKNTVIILAGHQPPKWLMYICMARNSLFIYIRSRGAPHYLVHKDKGTPRSPPPATPSTPKPPPHLSLALSLSRAICY